MLKLLIKKQLMEVFRSYFYNSRKNKPRSKGMIILFFPGPIISVSLWQRQG